MKDKFFIDTNIFIYSFDFSNKSKQEKATLLITQALEHHNGIISWQVVQEFLNVATNKFKTTIKPNDAVLYLQNVLSPLCEVFPNIALYEQTLKINSRFSFSFYDSLIIAAALEAECTILYSEDLQHEQKISQLKIMNPFI